jgi:hypothetical protein
MEKLEKMNKIRIRKDGEIVQTQRKFEYQDI